jgi:glycerol-3-phosphate dehydrogenase
MYIDQALANGAELIDKAKVKRVIIEDNKAIGVEFIKNGKSSRVLAPKIIISAGGIGSPIILRASGIERAGHDFFFDPLIGVRGIAEDTDVPMSEIPMSAGIHMLHDDRYVPSLHDNGFICRSSFAVRPDVLTKTNPSNHGKSQR